MPVNHSLDELPTSNGVCKAIQQISSRKAPGADSLPAKIYKAGGCTTFNQLTCVYQSEWINEQLSQEFKDTVLVRIDKSKGNRQSCNNHRGISLLSLAGNILTFVLLNHLQGHLETSTLLPESQCGFRTGIGTTDMIFATRQLQEICIVTSTQSSLTYPRF